MNEWGGSQEFANKSLSIAWPMTGSAQRGEPGQDNKSFEFYPLLPLSSSTQASGSGGYFLHQIPFEALLKPSAHLASGTIPQGKMYDSGLISSSIYQYQKCLAASYADVWPLTASTGQRGTGQWAGPWAIWDGAGSKLYEYAIDRIAYADRSPGVYQTYFAGVPLDFPPKTETGMPGWSSVGGGKPVWQKGVAATDISQSPAPYAWHKKSDLSSGFLNPATGTGYSEVEVDCEWEYDSNPYGSGSSCHGGKKSVPPKIGPYYRPVQGIPYVPKPFKLGDLVSFVNDVKKWSCNALSSGLTVSSGILKSDVAGGVPSSVKEPAEGAQAVATGFYNKVCGA